MKVVGNQERHFPSIDQGTGYTRELLNGRSANRKLAWAAMATAIVVACLLGPDLSIIGTTAIFVAVSTAILSRMQGIWFLLGCWLMFFGLTFLFGDEMPSLRRIGWISYPILMLLLACTLSVRLRRMLLATDSMRAALFGDRKGRSEVPEKDG